MDQAMSIQALNITVAHGSDEIRDLIIDALQDKHRVIAHSGTVVGLKQSVSEQRPDLIITGAMFPDGDGIDAVIELGKENPMPAVVVTSRRSLETVEKAMQDHVMAYLIEPVHAEDLEAALIVAWSRYQQLQDLSEQVSDLREALEHRKVIERAKGLLMASDELSEAEAFNKLRRRAQDERVRMVDIANEILRELAQS